MIAPDANDPDLLASVLIICTFDGIRKAGFAANMENCQTVMDNCCTSPDRDLHNDKDARSRYRHAEIRFTSYPYSF
ncbi:MAG TPA: hypothetical protein VGU61_09360 [Noviherbaspirillum sp.]|jgi:hypothetical protein|uniref:hypothetical protein n=1 Tax=Noviherbaspirillum sp. TaxID=1926288 RepID=UPI002DDDAB19|nr:hypothetical protein [Noviherbaspirillum sp.]HEV2610462.1 hypothetical protein [Noviherbaspirillum sp.]